MKICFFAESFVPRMDGASTATFYLVQQLAKEGHEVLLFAPRVKGWRKIEIEGVELVYLPSVPVLVYPDTNLGLLTPKLIVKINKFQPDVIHVTHPGTLGLLGTMFARLQKVPLIGTFHWDLSDLDLYGVKYLAEPLGNIVWKMLKDFYQKCDLVISPSKQVRQDLINQEFEVPVMAINNPIALNVKDVDQVEFTRASEQYSQPGKKTVLYVGRLAIEKNLKILLKIFQKVQEQLPNQVQFLLVGDGPQREDLENLAQELQLNAIFTGKFKHHELIAKGIYQLGDLFVTCSKSEVQPMSMIEAMQFGLPIVAAQATGMAEMVGDNGILVDPDNLDEFAQQIVYVLQDDKLRAAMSQAALKKGQEYDVVQVAKKHVQVYQELISK